MGLSVDHKYQSLQTEHTQTMSDFNLPAVELSSDLFERVQFSLSSRNAEAKVGQCAVHVFASKSVENLQDIQWQYVASGVPCLLRNRELHKSGRKYVWSMSLCLYDAHYGVLVWKAKLSPNSDYTAVADNFHVFALSEVDVIVGMLFSGKEQACELSTVFTTWNQERLRDDGKKGSIATVGASQMSRFRKEMISKPCNFQHIQGTQALDECLEIEKIKADIIAALFGLGTKAGRSEPDGEASSKRKGSGNRRGKKEILKPKMSFKEISVPRTSLSTPPVSPPLSPPASAGLTTYNPLPYQTSEILLPNTQPQTTEGLPPNPQVLPYQTSVDVANGYPDSSDVFVTRVSPTNQETSNYAQQVPMDNGGFEHTVLSQGSQPEFDQLQPVQTDTYFTSSQGSYGYNNSPPRLDLNLEKEFTESVLFQSPLTAN